MQPIGNYITIDPMPQANYSLSKDREQLEPAKVISATVDQVLPFAAGDTVYFLRSKQIIYQDTIFLHLDFVYLFVTTTHE